MKNIITEIEDYILKNLPVDYHARLGHLVDLEAHECAIKIEKKLTGTFANDYIFFLKSYKNL